MKEKRGSRREGGGGSKGEGGGEGRGEGGGTQGGGEKRRGEGETREGMCLRCIQSDAGLGLAH